MTDTPRKNITLCCPIAINFKKHLALIRYFLNYIEQGYDLYNMTLLALNDKQRKYFESQLSEDCKKSIKIVVLAKSDFEEKSTISEKHIVYNGIALYNKIKSSIEKCDILFMYSMGLYLINNTQKIADNVAQQDKTDFSWQSNMKIYLNYGIINTFRKLFNSHTIIRVIDFLETYPQARTFDPDVEFASVYPDDRDGLKFIKTYDMEHVLFNVDKNIEKLEKTVLFTFGYDTYNFRQQLGKYIIDHLVDNDDFKTYCRNSAISKEHNTMIPVTQYLIETSKSKFTFVIPATLATEVSVQRVYESIIRDCIPLFHKDVNYPKAFTEELSNFIRDNLVYDDTKFSTINDFVKSLDYDNLLKKLNSLQTIQDLRNVGKKELFSIFE